MTPTTLMQQVIEQHTDLAQHKHTPTAAMQTVAKRGLRLAAKHPGMDPVAVAVGRKVASGKHLADHHVEEMASFHAAHDGTCPTGDDEGSCEDMLWGGAPGAQWSSTRVAAMDVSQLAEVAGPSVLQLDQEGTGVNLEIFVRDELGEPASALGDDGLYWAPILRSGMLATRPGPGGTKIDEPLVFVSGYATDPHKEIGLQNLVDAFNDTAIQHVTIPTSHENNVLDNTGFIRAVKLVESKKRPGEMVLAAGHDIKDPEVLKKMQLGTVANRSCGIVYDYKNTGTGKVYAQAIDHVALTNKPWVTGMTPYGEIESEDDFATRDIVPMLLSEAPSTKLAEAETTDTIWNGAPARYSDQEWAKACVLDRGVEFADAKQRYSEPIREPDGTLNSNGVSAAAGRLASVKGASLSQKKQAARKLIAAYKTTGGQPPDGLRALVGASTNLSEDERKELLLADVQWGGGELSMNDITSQVVAALDEMGSPDEYYPDFSVYDVVGNPNPKALVRVDYGDPDGACDSLVIPLEVDGDKVSLSDHSQWTPVKKQWVADEDAAKDAQEVSSLLPNGLPLPGGLSETSDAVSAAVTVNPFKGGAVKPTPTEVLERLGLSEDAQAALAPFFAENEALKTQLAEATKASREAAVVTRVKELQGSGFTPGFCKRYEEIALGDNGDVAAVLNLSDDNGVATGKKEYTATQIAESLIAAMPKDESGKIALAQSANLLTSPLAGRPPLDAEEQAKREGTVTAPQTAEQWLSENTSNDPGLADVAKRSFNYDDSKKGA